MVKKGDIFTSYREGYSTENVMAVMDFEKGLLLHCVNKNGENVHVSENEIGEILGNIEAMF